MDMKRYLLILTAVLAFLPLAAKDSAKVKFVTKTHDFGYVKEDGGNVKCRFDFKNTGDEPLIIISARASCGCTRPSYPKEPIAPGEGGTIEVTYKPMGRLGAFDKSVSVRTNAGTVHLRIKGNVIP